MFTGDFLYHIYHAEMHEVKSADKSSKLSALRAGILVNCSGEWIL
jgi:hypothetical protein